MELPTGRSLYPTSEKRNGLGNSSFNFEGNSISLMGKIDSLTDEEISRIAFVKITVLGIKVKSMNDCCILWTVLAAFLFIIPLFVVCCSWWKKIARPTFEIPEKIY